MVTKPRKSLVGTALLGAVIFVVATATSAWAWYNTVGEVTYYPRPSGGNCYVVAGTLAGDTSSTKMDTFSRSRQLNASNACLSGTTSSVPGGWLGGKSTIIKNSNGAVCGSTTWDYSGGPGWTYTRTATSTKAACPGAFFGVAKARGYNGSSYVTSNERATALHSW